MRTSKTVNGETTEYLLDGETILKETTGDESIRCFYDAAGSPVSLTYSVSDDVTDLGSSAYRKFYPKLLRNRFFEL